MSDRRRFYRASLLVALVAVGALLSPTRAEASTFTYPSGGACSLAATGLNDCINAAGPGDTVNVVAGIYNEQATINEKITLAGPCSGSPARIDATGLGIALKVTHDDVTISCLTLQNGTDGISVPSDQNSLHVSNVKVSRFNRGMFTQGGDDLRVKDSTFSSMNSDGINTDGAFTNSSITGNTVSGAGGFCMVLNVLTGVTIANNNIGSCGNNGIYISSGSDNTVKNNNVHTTNNGGIGVSSSTTTISGNTVNGTENSAFTSDGLGNVIKKNTVAGNANGSGFEISKPAKITDNTVSKGAKFDGIACDPCDFATISGNSVKGRVGSFGLNLVGTEMIVSSNKVTGGGGSGISTAGDKPIVTGNTVSGGFASPGFIFKCLGACTDADLSNNVQSGTYDDVGYSIDTAGCAIAPCTTIENNKASDNLESGFVLNTSFATIKDNTATGSGIGGGGCSHGFLVNGGNNTLKGNTSKKNACDGFRVQGAANVFKKNTASNNGQMGFHNRADSNKYVKNIAKNNTGDGFNNDSTNASYTKNTASGNHRDCTSDSAEGAIVTVNVANACADGSLFGPDSSVIDND